MFSRWNELKSPQEETASQGSAQEPPESQLRLLSDQFRTSRTPSQFWRHPLSRKGITNLNPSPLELAQQTRSGITSTGSHVPLVIRSTHHKASFIMEEKDSFPEHAPTWSIGGGNFFDKQHGYSHLLSPSWEGEPELYLQFRHGSYQEAKGLEMKEAEIHRKEAKFWEQAEDIRDKGNEATESVQAARKKEANIKHVEDVISKGEIFKSKGDWEKKEDKEAKSESDSQQKEEPPEPGYDKRPSSSVPISRRGDRPAFERWSSLAPRPLPVISPRSVQRTVYNYDDMQPNQDQAYSWRNECQHVFYEPRPEVGYASLESQRDECSPQYTVTHDHEEESGQGLEGEQRLVEKTRKKCNVMSMVKDALNLKPSRDYGSVGQRARNTKTIASREQSVSVRKRKNVLKRSGRKRKQKQSPIDTSSSDIQILSRLAMVLEDVDLYKMFLSCPKSDAQTALDVLQMLLDTRDMEDYRQKQLITAMRRLSKKTKLFPLRFNLQGPVQVLKDSPTNFGSYADIYKARVGDEYLCLKVIRAYKNSLVKHMAKVYAREMILWGQLSHPNLLPFYGLYAFRSQISLVAPWAENGQLGDYLKQNPHSSRVLLCSDAAAGLGYLHENSIVHGDIRSTNVLVDGSGRACLADFGLSGVTDPQILHWASVISVASKGGSTRWQAPELHEPGLLNDMQPEKLFSNNQASDVFAWACLCYEAFTDQVPFFESRLPSTVILKISRGDHPTRPPDGSSAWTGRGLTASIWSIMEDCWKFQPQERPDIAAVTTRLEPELPVDTRPPSQWQGKYAQRFRLLQSTSYNDRQPTLEDLDDILSRLPLH